MTPSWASRLFCPEHCCSSSCCLDGCISNFKCCSAPEVHIICQLLKAMPVHSVVVGTSTVQHGGRAFCHYGACVEDITPTDLQLLKTHHKASALVGSNDLKTVGWRPSNKVLCTLWRVCWSSACLVLFSHLHQLHIWLKGCCRNTDSPPAPWTLKQDPLHPNLWGSICPQSLN